MKKLIAIALAAAALIPSAAVAKNITETRNISAFEKLEASTAVNIKYVQGTPVSLKISGDSEAVAATKTRLSDGKLKIWRTDKQQKNFGPDRTVTVTVTTPVIRKIELSGACGFSADRLSRDGDIEIDLKVATAVDIKNLNAAEVEIDCSGASKVSVAKSSTKSIDLDLSGASTATIAGNTGYLGLDCNGASEANLGHLSAVSGKVGLSGASKAKTNVQNLRKSHVGGASTLKNR